MGRRNPEGFKTHFPPSLQTRQRGTDKPTIDILAFELRVTLKTPTSQSNVLKSNVLKS